MADGVVLNAGSGGSTAATDDCGASGHAQVVKLAISTDGSATLIPAEATNGLDVDVTRVTPGTSATHLGKAEDVAHSTGDVGVSVLAVRRDTPVVGADVDGDYATLNVDADGRLYVNIHDGANTITVDGTVTANLAAGTNNIGDVDVLTLPALAAGTNNIGDVDVLTIAAGDNNIGNVDIVTMPNVTLAAGTNTNEIVGDAAHDAAVSGNPVLVAGYASAAAPANVSADGDVVRAWHLQNGAQATVITAAGALIGGDATNGLDVDVIRLPASTNTIEIVGDVAHDAAAGGNPVLIAGRATNSIEGLTQVAAADSTFLTADLNGCIVVRPYTTPGEVLSDRVADTGGTSTAFTNLGAGGAGIHNYLTSVTVWNSSATDGFVDIRDGAAGAVLATLPAPQTGGGHYTFPVPIRSSANTALAYDVSGAISTVYITAVGFQAKA